MTDENKVEIKQETCKCFCQSEWFKKFLTKTLAVFVGVFAALSLFTALHKPPMSPCPYGHGPMMRPAMHCHHHFKSHRMPRGEFYKKFEKRDFQRMEKRDFQRPDRPDFAQKPPVKE